MYISSAINNAKEAAQQSHLGRWKKTGLWQIRFVHQVKPEILHPVQKPILLNANHLFVWHKMFVTATICKYIFGLAQKIWTSPKHLGTFKRTRHKWSKSCTDLHILAHKNSKHFYIFVVSIDKHVKRKKCPL